MPLLSLIIWLPIVGGIFILLFNSKRWEMPLKGLSLLVAIVTLGLCAVLTAEFNLNTWQMQWVEKTPWLPILNIEYALGVDGFSLPLVVLTCFMSLIAIFAAFKSVSKNIISYLSAFLIMQGLMCGVFLATDSILFYIFFEAMLIPMFLIIGIWGGKNRIYATLKFFLYTFFGSIFLLISIIYLHFMAVDAGYTGSDVFSILVFHKLPLRFEAQTWLFWGFLIAFAVKVPMWPVHTWLPDAHVEAPTGGSVILAAITLKIGGYGFLRFLLPILPDACAYFAWIIIILSLMAIVYIGVVALVQKDMKKLIAYSSISHMGFVTLGIFVIFTISSDSAVMGIEGAIVQMISHGFISGALFLCIGVLYDRMHSRLIKDYGGVVNSMPVFASFFMLFAMANAGLPGTSGFVGEFLVILTAFKAEIWYAVIAASTLILGASYTLWMYKRVIFGKMGNNTIAALQDLTKVEFMVLSLLAAAVLLFGIWPAPLLDITHSSATNLVAHIMQKQG